MVENSRLSANLRALVVPFQVVGVDGGRITADSAVPVSAFELLLGIGLGLECLVCHLVANGQMCLHFAQLNGRLAQFAFAIAAWHDVLRVAPRLMAITIAVFRIDGTTA